MGYLTNNVIDGLSDNGGFASKVAVLIGKMMFQSVGFRLIFHIKTHVNWALLRSYVQVKTCTSGGHFHGDVYMMYVYGYVECTRICIRIHIVYVYVYVCVYVYLYVSVYVCVYIYCVLANLANKKGA
jgi:hypothetical protein